MSRRRIAVAITVAAVLTVVGASGSLRLATEPGQSLVETALGQLVTFAFLVDGAVLAATRPRNRIGWILLAIAVTWAIGNGAVDVAYLGIRLDPGSVPGASVYALVGAAVRDVSWYLAVLGLATYFPDGVVAGPRWRWLPRALVVAIVCAVGDTLLDPQANLTYFGPHWHNPIAAPPSLSYLDGVVFLGSLPLAVVAAGFAIAQLVGRWRRGGAIERRQIGLFAVAAILPIAAGPIGLAGGPGFVFALSVVPLPVTIAVAVLRYRLYDLERIVSRTVSYALVSGALAGVYVGCVALMTGVLPFDGAVGSAASVLVAVALFAPLRRRVQRVVDRRFNRARYDAEATVAAFASRLREQVELDAVLEDLVGVVHRTVAPAHVSLWLRGAR
ncbi:MAG TPA: hypothetical protein VFJ19_03640 [Nocardioidaceae bacterium]|nr:hypothetical protein [Nocardioidaceae bacterium]